MSRLTVKAVTAAMVAAGIEGELVRGNGYYYFDGRAFAGLAESERRVETRHIDSKPVDEWVDLARTALVKLSRLPCEHPDSKLECPFCAGTVDEDSRVCTTCQEQVSARRVCLVCDEELPEPALSTATEGEKLADSLIEVASAVKVSDTGAITVTNLLPLDGPVTEEDLAFAQVDTAMVETKVAEQVTPKTHRLQFYHVEHGADLKDAMDALTSLGCVLDDINTWDVSFRDERAVIQFSSTMPLKELKSLLSFTGVTI